MDTQEQAEILKLYKQAGITLNYYADELPKNAPIGTAAWYDENKGKYLIFPVNVENQHRPHERPMERLSERLKQTVEITTPKRG